MGYTVLQPKSADISNIEALTFLQILHARKASDPQYTSPPRRPTVPAPRQGPRGTLHTPAAVRGTAATSSARPAAAAGAPAPTGTLGPADKPPFLFPRRAPPVKLMRLHGVICDVRAHLTGAGAALAGFGSAVGGAEEGAEQGVATGAEKAGQGEHQVGDADIDALREAVTRLSGRGLTKGEILELVNLRPRSEVEVGVVVEERGGRSVDFKRVLRDIEETVGFKT